MKKSRDALSGEANKNKPLSAGYYILDCTEALLKEAKTDPREYGKGWYLRNLLILERLADFLRPLTPRVSRHDVDKYYQREEAIRYKIGHFAKALDPKLRDEIYAGIAKLEDDLSSLPRG